MFEPIDAFGDFEVNPSIVCILGEIVFINEFLWDVAELDADVFRPVEQCAEVKVGNVVACKASLWGREDAVEL